MNPKNTLSITEARKRIFDIAEAVQQPGVYYTLTENGKPKAVILSYEEYDSLVETLEVMQEMPDLDKSIKEVRDAYKSGKYKTWATLEELLAKQGFVLAEKSQHKYGVRTARRAKGGKAIK